MKVEISRAEARDLFNEGVPVAREGAPGKPPIDNWYHWMSTATGNYGVRNFDDTPVDGRRWFRDPARRTQDEAMGAAFRREVFQTATMSGGFGSHPLGSLPEKYAEEYAETVRSEGLVYTVRSYETPIAWIAESGVVMPPVRYSITTSQHQFLVAFALRFEGFHHEVSLMKGRGRSPYGPREGGF